MREFLYFMLLFLLAIASAIFCVLLSYWCFDSSIAQAIMQMFGAITLGFIFGRVFHSQIELILDKLEQLIRGA